MSVTHTFSLARTRAALERLDAVPVEDLDAHDAALVATGEAFAAETADRNEAAVARSVTTYPAGLAWLRRLCGVA